MKILGIETSCDETAAAVVESGTNILASVVSSSKEIQAKYGGVYPEVAAREQAKVMIPVLKETLSEYKKPIETIEAIAVTNGPGLIGSLMVGVETAKTLAFILNKPIIPVNHVLSHLYANWLIDKKQPPVFPALCLVVSGGHTELLLMKNHGKFKLLGQTLDDAAGEAFDKTARLLGLSYPGGPEIERLAQKGNHKVFNFPRGMISSKDYNFSFSGLKTAVLRELKKLHLYRQNLAHNLQPTTYNLQLISDLAASIQEAIVDALIVKTLKAAEEFKPKSILLAGGVAANSRLREKMKLKIENCKLKINFYVPSPSLCTDNASVVASFAYFNYKPISWQKIEVKPSLGLS